MAIPSLLGSYIDQTYQRLVQTDGAEFADGLGNPITFGTTPTGSFLTTASFNDWTGSSTSQFSGTSSYALTSSNIEGGTTNYIPVWLTDTGLSSSVMYQDGSNIGIGTNVATSNVSVFRDGNGLTIGVTDQASGFAINRDAVTGVIINPSLGNGYQFTQQGFGFEFQEYATNGNYVDLFVFTNGKLGIGTRYPNYKLEVSGSVSFTNLTNTTQTNVVSIDTATGELYYQPTSSIPSLQQVLDFNHDLTNDNNFQGTEAGSSNTGTNVLALGNSAGNGNSGNNIVAFGSTAARNNSGNNVIGIGENTVVGNGGNNVIGLGTGAGNNNGLAGMTIISNDFLPSFADHTAAVAAINAGNGATTGTYLYHNQATDSIGAVRI